METYTIQQLAMLSGVSSRTLRYYDEIGLLPPSYRAQNGYRAYGPQEVDRLQQILFYRALGVELSQIKLLLDDPGFNALQALKAHLHALEAEQERLSQLICTVSRTIAAKEGGTPMTDQEKFAGLQAQRIAQNEAAYGKELRQAYGDAAIDAANKKMGEMTQQGYQRAQALEEQVRSALADALKTGDPQSPAAQEACRLHKEWLLCYWPQYDKAMHLSLAQTYVDDPRFCAYYDAVAPGAAQFLRDALSIFCR